MKIEKYYEENVNLGNYQTARVGLKIISDKEIKNSEELTIISQKLFSLGKKIVQDEIEQLKIEKGVK